MDRESQATLVERALTLIEGNTSQRGAPWVGSVDRYLDPDRFQREMDAVFRQNPLAVCPSASLTRPGDCLAIDVAGLPLLVTRGQDGCINACLNACRHRGARLKAPGLSHQRVFVCPYHSWTYGLDGALRGRPHEADFPHAAPADCALARVAAGESAGLVWVVPRVLRPDQSAALDLDACLGRFSKDLRSWGYDGWVPFAQREFALAANWKLPFEGNLETYHFQYAHRNTIASLFYDNLLLADHDGLHHRLFLPKRGIEALRETPPADRTIGLHANVLYFFFPATLILHEGDHANVFTVLPEAPGRSRVLGVTLIPERPTTPKSTAYWEKNVASFWGALDEDFALGESAQSTFASGANATLYFGATECCSSKFHADVDAAIGAR